MAARGARSRSLEPPASEGSWRSTTTTTDGSTCGGWGKGSGRGATSAYLYAWDGKGFRFITDILGAAPLGLPIAERRHIEADPEDLVWVGDEQTFPARDGSHEHPLRRAETLDGQDVTSRLTTVDGRRVSPPRLRIPQLRGLAEPHGWLLDFGPLDTGKPLVLVMNGWLRFGGGMANIAASHDPSLPFPFPALEAEVAPGVWEPVDVVVSELIATRDEGLALIHAGDELSLSFTTDSLPPKPAGAARQFFLYVDGWDKDSDFHVTTGTQVGPLPFHGMNDRLYGRGSRPPFASDELHRRFNTRWVDGRSLQQTARR